MGCFLALAGLWPDDNMLSRIQRLALVAAFVLQSTTTCVTRSGQPPVTIRPSDRFLGTDTSQPRASSALSRCPGPDVWPPKDIVVQARVVAHVDKFASTSSMSPSKALGTPLAIAC